LADALATCRVANCCLPVTQSLPLTIVAFRRAGDHFDRYDCGCSASANPSHASIVGVGAGDFSSAADRSWTSGDKSVTGAGGYLNGGRGGTVSQMIDRKRHIQDESDRFGAVLATTDPASRVPTCPDWTAVDLLKHLIRVHQFWATVIGDRLTEAEISEFEKARPALPDDPAQLQDLRREATARLLTALSDRDPDEQAWSWFPPDQTVGFTWRMQTHEVTMHRVDAELAASLPISPISPEVAADGINHVVNVMWAWAPADVERRVTGTIELKATDTDQSWLVKTFRWSGQAWGQNFNDQIGCQRADAGEPDATVAGTAENLDLLVWTRADRTMVRSGDEHVLAEFQAMLDDGIQ
jgi:uncharacterized protein (TIGR03083 family)